MKRSAITSIALLAALVGKRRELRLHPHYSYVGKPALPDARLDA
jgi:hypothetical protein